MSTIEYSFDLTFAGVPLFATALSTDLSRRVDVYIPSRGSGADVFDRGQVNRVDTLSVEFVGTPSEILRNYKLLNTLANSGERRTFTHPIDGTWEVLLTQYAPSIGVGAVTASMTLTQVSEQVDASTNASNPDDEIFFDDVSVEAESADLALADAGLTDVSVSELVSPLELWDETTPLAERASRVDAIRDALSSTRARLRSLSYGQAIVALRSVMAVQRAVRAFSDTLRSGGLTFSQVQVNNLTSLPKLISELYGPSNVDLILAQVRAVNSIRDTLKIPPNTLLQLPTKESLRRIL